ncbi:hypothetical protein [Rosistilla oblonga]
MLKILQTHISRNHAERVATISRLWSERDHHRSTATTFGGQRRP